MHNPRTSSAAASRAVDVAIGPQPADLDDSVTSKPFLNYQVVVVAGPARPLAAVTPSLSELQEQTWLLGPSVAADPGLVPTMVRRINVPETHQQIFQSHAAALEEAKRGKGVALAVAFAVGRRTSPSGDLEAGHRPRTRRPRARGASVACPGRDATPAAAELARFVTHPAGDPGDAARRRGHRRAVPAVDPRDALELSAARSRR